MLHRLACIVYIYFIRKLQSLLSLFETLLFFEIHLSMFQFIYYLNDTQDTGYLHTSKYFILYLRLWKHIKYMYSCRYNGKTELRREVPHSITSWVLTAFSVNDAHGLGLIEEPRKVVINTYTYLYNLYIESLEINFAKKSVFDQVFS